MQRAGGVESHPCYHSRPARRGSHREDDGSIGLLPSHRIIYTDQRPHVAIFEDAHCSLALGQAVYALWNAVRPAEKVTDAAFGDWTAKFIVVADVAANPGFRGFAAQA